jgi:hypothetical protein
MKTANKYLEQRVLDKSIDTQDERLEQSEQILKHRVAAVVEESLLLKIKRLHANPISKSKSATQEHDLETLARAKEFVYNYDMLTDIPKGKYSAQVSIEIKFMEKNARGRYAQKYGDGTPMFQPKVSQPISIMT